MAMGRKIPTPPEIKLKWASVFSPVAGLNYAIPSTLIGDKFTPSCSEVTFRDGAVKKASGTSDFGNTATKPIAGVVMRIFHFKKTDGTTSLMAFSTEQIYKYNTATEVWDLISAVGKDLVARVTVIAKSQKNLVCRVTVEVP